MHPDTVGVFGRSVRSHGIERTVLEYELGVATERLGYPFEAAPTLEVVAADSCWGRQDGIRNAVSIAERTWGPHNAAAVTPMWRAIEAVHHEMYHFGVSAVVKAVLPLDERRTDVETLLKEAVAAGALRRLYPSGTAPFAERSEGLGKALYLAYERAIEHACAQPLDRLAPFLDWNPHHQSFPDICADLTDALAAAERALEIGRVTVGGFEWVESPVSIGTVRLTCASLISTVLRQLHGSPVFASAEFGPNDRPFARQLFESGLELALNTHDRHFRTSNVYAAVKALLDYRYNSEEVGARRFATDRMIEIFEAFDTGAQPEHRQILDSLHAVRNLSAHCGALHSAICRYGYEGDSPADRAVIEHLRDEAYRTWRAIATPPGLNHLTRDEVQTAAHLLAQSFASLDDEVPDEIDRRARLFGADLSSM